MANNVPCNQVPVKFINCCQVMDCIDIKSTDNTVTIEKSDCGVDIRQTGNNLDKILKINEGDCISFVREFLNGVLTLTPIIDFDCIIATIGEDICGLCPPPEPPIFCPTPLSLSITML